MNKLRADSAWSKLTAEQRETLEGWLFEEHTGYREALERAQKEFGVTASLTSLAVFYQRLAEERMHRELLEVKNLSAEFDKVGADMDDLAATAMTLAAKRMLQLAVASPGNVRELVSLGRLLAANEALNIKQRWLEIEEEKMDNAVRERCDRRESNVRLQASIREMMAGLAEQPKNEGAKAPQPGSTR